MSESTDLKKAGVTINTDTVNRIAGGEVPGSGGTSWFGPGPLAPGQAPEEVRGRQFDYPTGYNQTIRPRAYEGFSSQILRNLADGYDLLRLVIETRKDQIELFQWEVVEKDGLTASDQDLKEVEDFFQRPDREHHWGTWLRAMLEDLFVLDAVCVYPRITRGGELYSMELVDPATIRKVLDSQGRTPLPPSPAYQQVLKGFGANDYTREELAYFIRNFRTNKVYGYSPVEQVFQTVNIALRRQMNQLAYFTEGNIPEAIMGVPEDWSMDDLKEFQHWWDSVVEGDPNARRRMKFVPTDARNIAFTKTGDMKEMFDEWLARIVCFAFSISPTMLVKETNRATADRVADTAKEEGVMPLLRWLKGIMDRLIQEFMQKPNIEFRWKVENKVEPLVQAQTFQIYKNLGVFDVAEIRSKLGEPELTPEELDARRLANTPPQLMPFAAGPGGVQDPNAKDPNAPPGDNVPPSANNQEPPNPQDAGASGKQEPPPKPNAQ